MIIVGVGCAPGLMTQQAIGVLSGCRRVFGASRSLSLARPFLLPDCEEVELLDFTLKDLPEDAVVLSTGDPMLGGLGRPGAEVIPGISSLQLACARLGVPWESVTVVSAHRQPVEEIIDLTVGELVLGRAVFMLASPGLDVSALASRLESRSIDHRMAVLEDLGYPQERIAVGTFTDPPVPRSRMFSLFLGEW